MKEINSRNHTHAYEVIRSSISENFREPIIAKDGHGNERVAITRSISEQDSSPLTMKPSQINDLQPDDRLEVSVEQYCNEKLPKKTSKSGDLSMENRPATKNTRNCFITTNRLLIVLVVFTIAIVVVGAKFYSAGI
jgi:hypothetical protein